MKEAQSQSRVGVSPNVVVASPFADWCQLLNGVLLPMKPNKILSRAVVVRALGLVAVLVAALLLFFWRQVSEAVGPMSQHESQCLVCSRERVEVWVCGAKVRDEVSTNEHSDWIDSFTPVDHRHVWLVATSYHRASWFGRKSIGCGGIPVMSRIFSQRSSLGESESQQLARQFQQLVQKQPPVDSRELRTFDRAVAENPSSLLVPTDASKPNAID